jgi:hypothetical protein
VGRIEGGGALCIDLSCRALKAFTIPTCQDQLRSMRTRLAGSFKSDTGAAADDE